MCDTPPPTFEVLGELSDEAIEALAALLLSVADQKEAEVQSAKMPVEFIEAT